MKHISPACSETERKAIMKHHDKAMPGKCHPPRVDSTCRPRCAILSLMPRLDFLPNLLLIMSDL